MKTENSNGFSKVVDDSLAELNKLQQEFKDWLALDKPIVEYDDANCALTLHVHVRTGMGLSEQFCAVFNIGRDSNELTGIPMAVGEFVNQRHSVRHADACVEQAMLIDIPKFIQDIERVGVVWPKRLQTLDDCGRARINALNHGGRIAIVMPYVPSELDGEVLGVCWRFGNKDWESGPSTSIGGRNQLPNGMFKRGARVTYDFTCENGEMDKGIVGDVSIYNQLIGLHLVLENETIRLIGPKLDVELIELVLSPVTAVLSFSPECRLSS